MSQKQVLMSSPDFFKVEYSINPWMVAGVTVDLDLAKDQWNNLKSTATVTPATIHGLMEYSKCKLSV